MNHEHDHHPKDLKKIQRNNLKQSNQIIMNITQNLIQGLIHLNMNGKVYQRHKL